MGEVKGIPRPPLFFVLQFCVQYNNGSGRAAKVLCSSIYHTECKPKSKQKKTGEAWEQGKGGGVGWRPGNDEKVNLGHRKWETMKWRGKEWRSEG